MPDMFTPQTPLPPDRVAGDSGHVTDHQLMRAALAELRAHWPATPDDIGAVTKAYVDAAIAAALQGNAPPTPVAPNLTASVTGQVANLLWTTVTGATTYSLSRNGTSIYSGSATTYTDTLAPHGASSTYTVTASNVLGSSSPVSVSKTIAIPADTTSTTPTLTVSSLTLTPTSTGQYSAVAVVTANIAQTINDFALAVRDATNPVDDGQLDPDHKLLLQLPAGDTTITWSGTVAAGSYNAHVAYQRVSGGTWVHDATTKSFTVASGTPTTPTTTTRLLTQFHDASIPTRMESYMGMRIEGSTVFNDGASAWSTIAVPWYTDASSNLPRGWRNANPTIRNTFCVTQAPFPNSDAASCISGANDANIRASVKAAVDSFGPTVIIRLGHEMNSWGGQYPWGNTKVSQADYKAAFRKWVTVARAAGYTQVRWDFCGLMDGPDLEGWYPGSDVVDIISVDLYGMKYGSNNPTESELIAYVKTGATQSLARLLQLCTKYGKPYAFPEYAMTSWQKPGMGSTATTRGSGDHVSYIDAVFDFIAANNGTSNPAVYCAYQSYFNRPDGGIEVSLDGDPGGGGSHLAASNVYARFKTRNRSLRPDIVTA